MALEKEIIREGAGGTSSLLLTLRSLYKNFRFLYLKPLFFSRAEGEGSIVREILARFK